MSGDLIGTPSNTSRALYTSHIHTTPHTSHSHTQHTAQTPSLQHIADAYTTRDYTHTHTHTHFSSECSSAVWVIIFLFPLPTKATVIIIIIITIIPGTSLMDRTSQCTHSCAHRQRHLPGAACSPRKLSRPIRFMSGPEEWVLPSSAPAPAGTLWRHRHTPFLPFSLAYWPLPPPPKGSLASLLGVQDNVLPGVWTIPGLLDKADVTASGWDASAFSLSISATT